MSLDPERLRKAFFTFKEEWLGKPFAFVTHRQADVDAITSAAVLARHFPNSILAVPQGKMDSPAKKIVESFGIEWVSLEDVGEEIPVVAVDTSSTALLPIDGRKVVCIIDHHREGPDNFQAPIEIRDPEARATAEIVAILLEGELSQEDASLLAAGIISDTMRFITATERTLDVFISLYKRSNLDYGALLNLAFPNLPLDEKKAILEGLKNLSYEAYGDVLVATSITPMKNGSVAGLLVQAGDVAFVAQYVEEERYTRVSARASPHIDVPLNEVMAKVASHFGGKGGGHRKAAGCIAYAMPEEVLSKCREVVREYL